MMAAEHSRNLVEAALLAAGRSVTVHELLQVFDALARPSPEELRHLLAQLGEEYAGRGIELRETAAGFRIQVRRELAAEVSRLWPERPAKYSRALLETLALIAYRQPVTRAEIEAVRGVAVNPNIIKTLLERSWIRVVGHRDLPGHPELLGTTRDCLDYFGLRSLDQLPEIKRDRKIFYLGAWLGAYLGGQTSPQAEAVVKQWLAQPGFDADLRRKVLENADPLERTVRIRTKFPE